MSGLRLTSRQKNLVRHDITRCHACAAVSLSRDRLQGPSLARAQETDRTLAIQDRNIQGCPNSGMFQIIIRTMGNGPDQCQNRDTALTRTPQSAENLSGGKRKTSADDHWCQLQNSTRGKRNDQHCDGNGNQCSQIEKINGLPRMGCKPPRKMASANSNIRQTTKACCPTETRPA